MTPETPWSVDKPALVCRLLGDPKRLAVALCLLEQEMTEDAVAIAASIPVVEVRVAVDQLSRRA